MKSTPLPPSQHVLLSRKSLRSRTEHVTIADFAMTPHSPFPLHVQQYFRTRRSSKLCHFGGVQIHPLKTYENIVDKVLREGEAGDARALLRKGTEGVLGLRGRKVERHETMLVLRRRADSGEAEDIRAIQIGESRPNPSAESSLLRDWLHKEQEKSPVSPEPKALKRTGSIPHFTLPNSHSRPNTKPLHLPTRTHSDFIISIPSTLSPNASPGRKERKRRKGKWELLRPVLGTASRKYSRRTSQRGSGEGMELLSRRLSP